jgi:hypothetical protein
VIVGFPSAPLPIVFATRMTRGTHVRKHISNFCSPELQILGRRFAKNRPFAKQAVFFGKGNAGLGRAIVAVQIPDRFPPA